MSETVEKVQHDDIPTRKSLLNRLRNWDDASSWQRFFQTYWRLIYGFAIRRGLTHSEAQEVVQETVVAVARNIGKFNYSPEKCAFKTWLFGVTHCKVVDQFRVRARHPAAPERSSEQGADHEEELNHWDSVWEEEWQKNLMETAIQRVKDKVTMEQYQAFDLFVLKQWPAADVASALGITRASIYITKHRISKLIRKEVDALRAEQVAA